MRRFADRATAGALLAEVVVASGERADAVVVGLEPTGAPVAEAVARALAAPLVTLAARRVDDGPQLGRVPHVRGRTAIVVDAGVETGALAHAVAAALREGEAERIVLAVPVCPREALATLRLAYDEVIALEQPMARRSMRWHYDSLA